MPRDHADRSWIHSGGRLGRLVRRFAAWLDRALDEALERLGAYPTDWHGPF